MTVTGCDQEGVDEAVVMFNSYSQKTDIQQVVYRILDTNLDRTRE